MQLCHQLLHGPYAFVRVLKCSVQFSLELLNIGLQPFAVLNMALHCCLRLSQVRIIQHFEGGLEHLPFDLRVRVQRIDQVPEIE